MNIILSYYSYSNSIAPTIGSSRSILLQTFGFVHASCVKSDASRAVAIALNRVDYGGIGGVPRRTGGMRSDRAVLGL